MEFGLSITQFTDRWDHVLGDATLAESVGLDSVWLVDHLAALGDASSPVFEGWTALTAVAARTDRVRVGHLVLAASFRNPGLLAKMATTLDHVAGGRLDLGLGAGWYEPEYDAFGYRFPSSGDRRRYLKEYVEALRALFDGGPGDYRGRYVELDGAVCSPLPVQPGGPPIVIGAARPRMLALTGALADVWNCPYGSVPKLEALQQQVRQAAGGRVVRTTLQLPVVVGRTSAEADAALEVARSHLAWMGDISASGIIGTVEQAVDQVAAYADRGVDGIVAILPGSRARPQFIEAYGELVARCRS